MTSLPLYYRSASQLRILSFKPIPPRLHELSCLYLTLKICESLVGNIRSSSENDEFLMASSPMYVVPFINEIIYNETREFSTQHLGVRRPIPQIQPSSVLNSVKMIFNLTGHPDTTYDSTHEECQVKSMSN